MEGWHPPPRMGPQLGDPLGSLRPSPLLCLSPRAPALLTLPLPPPWPDSLPCASCGFCGWGRWAVGLLLLPHLPSPFSASPLACLRSAFLVVPIPWPLKVGPVAQEPGVGHYVGRPLACQGLTGPQWPGPAPWASPFLLMTGWYSTPSGAVGRRFTAILAAEWRGVLNRSWNSERPLIFSHVVLTKTLGIRRDWEIRARITRRMDLWER